MIWASTKMTVCLGQCMYAYDCCYWKVDNRSRSRSRSTLIKLDMNTRKFCTVDLPSGLDEPEPERQIIIVESGESKVAMFSQICEGTSIDYYTLSQNSSQKSHEWHRMSTIPLPAHYTIMCFMGCRPAEGYILIECLQETTVFSLEVKSLNIERVRGITYNGLAYPYFGFPPSMSPRRIRGYGESNQKLHGLREELDAIVPNLEEMRQKKVERWDQFVDVMDQIKKVASALPLRMLDELTKELWELQFLQKEKSDRLKQVMEHLNTLHSLCEVLGIDFKQTVYEVHPSLGEADGSKNLSNSMIERLASVVNGLREMKVQRMQKLQDLAPSMLELWNLMDTPLEEQQVFQNVTSNIAASEHEITEPNTLSIDYLSYVESEVLRLEQSKASKMKDLVLKKKTELEERRRCAHLIGEEGYAAEFSTEAIEAGAVDPALVLEQIESLIATVKEEALSRKDILEKVERWLNACVEEAWLEDYNKDDNRYNAGRGAHLTLKRAEKARILVNKIPGMVDVLTTKIHVWEKEREKEFTYDGVRLLSMLEEYMIVRQEKELEKKRQRDQKKIQDQIKAEQEALYGSKPSPSKPQSTKKVPRNSMGGANRRLSLGGATMQAPKTDILHSKTARAAKKTEDLGTLSPNSRGLDIAGLPIKKLTFNASTLREAETPRKPFAQIIPGNNVPPTPARPISNDTEEENKTPKTFATLNPKTPMTVTAPMQVATTPVVANKVIATPVSLFQEKLEQPMLPEEIEYSFEERRLAVYLARQVA